MGYDSLTDRKLSIECSNSLKGIFAICVLIHHLYLHSGLTVGKAVGVSLQSMGYLSVACFFFLSGYGLYASYQKQGQDYIKSFPKRKIAPFYCIIILFSVIYLAEAILLGKPISAVDLIMSISFGGTVIINGWYLQVQLLLYVFFFLAFHFIQSDKLRFATVFAVCVIFCFAMYLLDYPTTWFESIFAFPLGMIWCKHDCDTKYFSKKKCSVLAIFELLLFSIAFLGSHLINIKIAALILKMFSAVLFAVLVATVTKLVKIENKITKWLGKYSIEIYAFQGLFLVFFHSRFIYLDNKLFYAFMVTIFVFTTAVLFHPITREVYLIARKQKK